MILDVCCGPKMMWFDKNRSDVVYGDKRQESHIWITNNGDSSRKWEIKPDILYDFIALPFKDESFDLIVFDPPHLTRCSSASWLALKYGKLFSGWEEELAEGFSECMRVLKPYSILIFKWSEVDIKISRIIHVLGKTPLFGHTTTQNLRTHWLTFMKNQ